MRQHIGPIAAAIGFALSLLTAAPCAASGQLIATFNNPTPAHLDNFGFSVAASDEFIFIAATGDDVVDINAGTVYVYDAQDYGLVRTLVGPAPRSGDSIGTYLATYEDYLLVGAWTELTNSLDKAGAAYVFDPHTGDVVHRLTSPTPAEDDRFGRWLVGVDGYIMVGAYKDDLLGQLTGATYAFDVETGLLSHTIFDPTPAAGDRFGYSLAAMGDKVLVAAYRDSELAPNSGGVFVFDAATGSYEQKILNPEPATGDLFGRSIATRGHYLAVGASDDNGVTVDDGSAYLIDVLSGDLVATFRNPSPDALDEFGTRITFVGDNVLVGAWKDDSNGEDAGAAYLFDGVTGALLHTFTDPLADEGNFFGFSLAAVGTDILISAHGTAAPEEQIGSAYLFDGSGFLAAPGDATHDGVVDALDYFRWAEHFTPKSEIDSMSPDQLVRGPADGDFNFDGIADGLDYLIWSSNFSPIDDVLVPEPATGQLLAMCVVAVFFFSIARVRRKSASVGPDSPLSVGITGTRGLVGTLAKFRRRI